MISVNRIAAALYGCYRLARRDTGGMAYFDRTPQGMLESFFAAVLIWPIATVLTVADKWEELQVLYVPGVMVKELLFYVIRWTLVPVLAIGLLRWIDREPRYFDLIVAYNWITIPSVLVFLPVQILFHGGLIEREAFLAIAYPLLFLVLFYEWFVVKTALDITGGLAAGLVAGDFVLAQILNVMSEGMIYGG